MIKSLGAIDLFDGEGLSGFGPLGNPGGNAPSLFNRFLSSVIGIITVVAIIWVVIAIVSGAIGIITSSGDKAAMQSAVKKITSAVIGLVFLIASLYLIKVIGTLFGIDNILNPAYFIDQLGIQK